MAFVNETDSFSVDDSELVECAKKGCNSALIQILNRYSAIVAKKSASFNSLIGLDKDDLYQEGMIGLLSAVYSYDKNRGSSFTTYADLVISRKMYSALRSAGNQKNIPLHSYVTLDEVDKNSSDLSNPEVLFFDNEDIDFIIDFIHKNLSKTESKVLRLSLYGLSYSEIAEILDISIKSVDNALQRIRKKYRNAK